MSNVGPETTAWFKGRLPKDWFTAAPELSADRDEVVLVGRLADVELEKGASDAAVASAREGRITRFREETRGERMKIADEVESKWGRKLSWGVAVGDQTVMFTHLGVPVMTRIRLKERLTLDTLVDAGVARTRSDALSWCVKLVAKNEEKWLGELRDAFKNVEKVRKSGPSASA